MQDVFQSDEVERLNWLRRILLEVDYFQFDELLKA